MQTSTRHGGSAGDSLTLTRLTAMTPTVRSCCRCGREFQTDRRALICPECAEKTPPPSLSFREKQIVTIIAATAAPNKELAYQLHLSEGTVKEYLNRIFHKLNISSRGELIIWASKHPDLTIDG